MAKLIGYPKWQFLTSTGAVLAGGTIDFYSPGTTTRKDIYDDTDELTTLTNPVTLDAAGQVPSPVFAKGLYDLVIRDSDGNTVETVSNWGDADDDTIPNVNTITKTTSYTLTADDLSGQLTVRIDISSGNVAITELGLSSMKGTVRYVVVDDDGTGATYKAEVKNFASTEVWTGYREGDFFECSYDGSTRTICSEQVTVYGRRSKTANEAIAADTNADVFDSNVAVTTDVGGWDDGTDGPTAVFNCLMEVDVHTPSNLNSHTTHPVIRKDGTAIWDITAVGTSAAHSTQTDFLHHVFYLSTGVSLDCHVYNRNTANPVTINGDAAEDESYFAWRVIKRMRS